MIKQVVVAGSCGTLNAPCALGGSAAHAGSAGASSDMAALSVAAATAA